MEIIRHYACSYNERLNDFIDQNQISYQQDYLPNTNRRIYFDIAESDPLFTQLLQIPLTDCVVTKQVKYTKKEIENSPWLACNPTSAKINLTNEDITFAISEQYGVGKARHRTLTGKPFYVTKPLNHNANQHFFTTDQAPNQLFCTEHAKSLLQKANLPLSFNAVLNSKKNVPVGDLYDVCIKYVLPPEALNLANSEEIFTCPICGVETFLPPILLQVRANYLSVAPDICRTANVFSWGGNYAAPINIISHDVYSFLLKNHLVQGLQFEPILLI